MITSRFFWQFYYMRNTLAFMKVQRALIFILSITVPALLISVFPSNLYAEKAARDFNPPLFTPAATSSTDPKNKAAIRSRRVQVDMSHFAGRDKPAISAKSRSASSTPSKQAPKRPSEITINLFDDVVVKAKRLKNYSNPSGSYTWIGKVDNHQQGTALFVVRENSVYGVIELPGRGRFTVRPDPDGTHTIEQVSEGATLSGEDDTIVPEDRSLPAPSEPQTQQYSPEVQQYTVEISNDNGSIIDVFVAYDQDSLGGSVAPADAQSYAELFIAYTNLAYENSGVGQRVWLVGSVDGFDYNDTTASNLSDNLYAAQDGSITGLHAKRDEYHADLVMFFAPYSGSSCGGLAFIQDSVNSNVSWNTWGFSTMQACSFGSSTFAHELGHNMGSRHDWYVDNGTTPASIAHGFVSISKYYKTIMSYNNRCVSELGINCPTIPYFSNPQISYDGTPTGVASGTSISCVQGIEPTVECDADNKTNFNNKALITSQFRDSRLTWTGTVDSNWTNAANWIINEGAPGSTTPVNRVPRSYDNVYIPSGLATYPTIAGDADARELVIADGATLNMATGTLNVGWSWEDNGGFNSSGGTVVFSGPIGVTVASESAFSNVQVGTGSDSTVVALENDFNIDGDLLISAGAMLNAADQTINLAGNWTEEDATGFNPGTGSVIFDGSNQIVSKNTGVSLLNEDFSAFDSSCCTTTKPSGWDNSDGDYYQGDLIDNSDGAANRWRNQTDGYLYTPALTLQQGITYQLQYDVAIRQNFSENDGTLSPQNVSVYLGTSQNSADMTKILSAASAETSTSYQTRTINNITVATSGTYYIGFRAQQSGNDYTSFDDISLTGTGSLSFYNLQVADGTTTFDQNVAVANTLQVDSGATADFSGSDIQVVGVITNYGSILLPATKYLLDYDGNANTGGLPPSSQFKLPGEDLIVASNSGGLTKTGYSFSGWNTAANGTGTDYAEGASYTADASARLYAKWIPLSYTVTYDANGSTSGSVPDSQIKTYGIDLILASNTGDLERDDYTFSGWNTSADGSGTDYAEGETFTGNSSQTLYAKWISSDTRSRTILKILPLILNQ